MINSNILATSAALLALPASINAALYNTTIHTKHGDVVGYPAFNSTPTGNLTNWKDITVWKGIPFAADTSGKNRFRAPQAAPAWNSTLYASSFGDVCPDATFGSGDVTISENCLNLNVWTSATSTKEKRPVVMWSYPAGGSAADALFNGAGMADKGVVFVNYNYRSGAFGWLASKELNQERIAEVGTNSSGNYALLDQFAALKWIHENIADFGGDPDKITIMGQSAGSAATYRIVNSPLTKGLIKGAIIESGVRYPYDPECTTLAESYATLDSAIAQGEEFLAYLNVTTLEEARALPFSTVETGLSFQSTTWNFRANLDYYSFPATYLEILQRGAANKVPIITGNTKDESGATYGLNITLSTYLSDLNSTFSGEWVDRFLELYPANDSTTASGAYNSQWTDRSKVGTYLWTQAWYNSSSTPVWNYIWNHANPSNPGQGAYHESEINYVLNNLYDTTANWTATDYEIAEKMNGYWVNFIKHQDPNGDGLAYWPKAGANATVQVLGDAFEQVPAADAEKVQLFKDWFATLPNY